MLLLLVANFKMMARDRQTFFWALAFPLIFVAVFGLVDFTRTASADIAIFDNADNEVSQQVAAQLEDLEFLEFDDTYDDQTEAQAALEDGDLDYVLVLPPGLGAQPDGSQAAQAVPLVLFYDQANIQENQLMLGVLQHVVDEANLSLAGSPRPLQVSAEPVSARQVEYFDLVLVGLVGMGLMVHSVIALGVKVSTYRNQAIFKRILATPLQVHNYFVAEVVAHLVLAMVQTGVILAVGVWVFGANLGSGIWLIFPIAALGNVVFLNLGFIVASRANSGGAASGMGNAITLPVMFLSGTFFATSTLPGILPDLMRFLPLTPMLDAMREVTIEGNSIWSTWPEMAILAGWIAATAALAVRVFRFS